MITSRRIKSYIIYVRRINSAKMYFIHLVPSVLLTPPARDISITAAEANEISSLATRVIRFFTLINFPLGVIISLKSFPIFVSI